MINLMLATAFLTYSPAEKKLHDMAVETQRHMLYCDDDSGEYAYFQGVLDGLNEALQIIHYANE